MTSHELARQLLAAPDLPVVTGADTSPGDLIEIEELVLKDVRYEGADPSHTWSTGPCIHLTR